MNTISEPSLRGVRLSEPRVIVVGGGPAGLAAALTLADLGIPAAILERDQQPGGRSGVDRVGDWQFDRAAEFITSFYHRTRSLIRRLGLESTLVRLPLRGSVVVNGQTYALPLGPLTLIRSPLLSAVSKRRILLFGFELLRWRRFLRWGSLERAAFLDDMSAATYFAQRVGQDYVDLILRPSLESLVLSPVTSTSRVIPLSQATEAPGMVLLCPRGGLATLWEAAARSIDFRPRKTAKRVARSEKGVRVDLEDGSVLNAEAAIVAIPAPEADQVVAEEIPEKRIARAARYSPVIKLHVSLMEPFPDPRPRCPAGPGNHPLAGVGILETKETEQHPPRRGGLNVCASPWFSAELISQPDDRVRERLLAEAESLLQRPIGSRCGDSIVRLPHGVPSFHVGWLKSLSQLRRELSPAPIVLAGDYLASPSIEGAVRSGEEAAQRVCAYLQVRRFKDPDGNVLSRTQFPPSK